MNFNTKLIRTVKQNYLFVLFGEVFFNIFYFMKTTVKTRLPEQLDDSRRYNTMCVCEICTCGNHRCPPAGHRPFNG